MNISITILKLKTFIKSLWWHVYAGFPKSTQQQIDLRYNICKRCEKFISTKSECGVCGCSLGDKKRFMNKLAWADQSCPIGKWSSIKE